MKHYNRFAEVIQNIYMLASAKIITEDERDFILHYGYRSSFHILVLKTIHHLLSGDTSYFYKLQYCDDKLATTIQTEVYLWKQKISTGKFSTYVHIYLCRCLRMYTNMTIVCNYYSVRMCIL